MADTAGTVQPQDQGSGTLRLGAADSSSRHPLEIVSDAIDKVTESCYVTATAAFALVMLLGVFFRYVLNNSLSWSDEVAVVMSPEPFDGVGKWYRDFSQTTDEEVRTLLRDQLG